MCNPSDPASLCNGAIVVRVFIDFGCDRFFNRGLDWPLSGALVMARLPDGQTRAVVMNEDGEGTITGVDLPPGQAITLAAEEPVPAPTWISAQGFALASCPGSGQATLTRSNFSPFGVTYVDLRYTLVGR